MGLEMDLENNPRHLKKTVISIIFQIQPFWGQRSKGSFYVTMCFRDKGSLNPGVIYSALISQT